MGSVQLQVQETATSLEAALAAEDFEEASALQAEHDAAEQRTAALAASHGFSQPRDFPELTHKAREAPLATAHKYEASAESSPHAVR